ncbi:MAG: hypothetical protein ACREBS_09655 [Nitrososphaerales archaeon]
MKKTPVRAKGAVGRFSVLEATGEAKKVSFTTTLASYSEEARRDYSNVGPPKCVDGSSIVKFPSA